MNPCPFHLIYHDPSDIGSLILVLIILKEAPLVSHVEEKKGLYCARYQFACFEYRSIMVRFQMRLHYPRVPPAAIRRVRVP